MTKHDIKYASPEELGLNTRTYFPNDDQYFIVNNPASLFYGVKQLKREYWDERDSIYP